MITPTKPTTASTAMATRYTVIVASASARPTTGPGILGRMAERPASDYREMAPPQALADHVECLWIHRVGDGEAIYHQPVFPDGRIDVVAVGDDVAVAGPARRPTTLALPPGTVTLGVRFRPGAAPALLGTG